MLLLIIDGGLIIVVLRERSDVIDLHCSSRFKIAIVGQVP